MDRVIGLSWPGRSAFTRAALRVVLVVVACYAPSVFSAEQDDKNSRAVQLYDAGDYAEAQTLLSELVAEGQADGPTLYRLYYCQSDTGDSAARETLLKARAALKS
jgi:hypothetical protein